MLMRLDGTVLCQVCQSKLDEKLLDEAPDANSMNDQEIQAAEVVVWETGSGDIKYSHGACYIARWANKNHTAKKKA